jgi:hypothetical protein
LRERVDALAAWALADATTTLSPDHPVNRALAEAGAGTVPRLLHADAHRRVATLACRPLQAKLELPFGWHAIEHEVQLALFEPSRQVQIQIGLVDRDGRDAEAVLDALELELCGQRPAPGTLRLHHGGWHALALREPLDGRIPLEQYHLLTPGPDAQRLTHARVIATPPRSADAVGLAEALLVRLVFDRPQAPAAGATNETSPGLR